MNCLAICYFVVRWLFSEIIASLPNSHNSISITIQEIYTSISPQEQNYETVRNQNEYITVSTKFSNLLKSATTYPGPFTGSYQILLIAYFILK